jgi:hypothetical protein
LSERAGTLLNLATCHQKQGKTASAWAEFNEVAALSRKQNRSDRESYAKAQAKELEPKLSRVTFSVSPKVHDPVLKLDGKQITASAWGVPLPVDPGKHQVEVSAPARQPYSKNIDVKGDGAVSTIEIPELKPEATNEPASTEPAPSEPETTPAARDEAPHGGSGSAKKTIGWLAIGVGVVGVGVGGYFGLRTFSKKKDADDHCGAAIGDKDANACDPTGLDLRDQAKRSGTLSTIGFAVGAVGIGAGVILLLTSSSHSERTSGHAFIAPSFDRNGAGVMLGARL